MRNGHLHALAWTLIYGGLLALCLGLSVTLRGAGFGGRIIAGGLVAVGLGGCVIWWRSRRSP